MENRKDNGASVPQYIPDANQYKQCESCRWVGTLTLGGLSGKFLYDAMQVPPTSLTHRRVLLGMSVVFAGMSYYRWIID